MRRRIVVALRCRSSRPLYLALALQVVPLCLSMLAGLNATSTMNTSHRPLFAERRSLSGERGPLPPPVNGATAGSIALAGHLHPPRLTTLATSAGPTITKEPASYRSIDLSSQIGGFTCEPPFGPAESNRCCQKQIPNH